MVRGFLLAYGTSLTFAPAAAVRDPARQHGLRRLAAVDGVVASLGALAAAFDPLENVCLLLTLDGAGAAFPLLATIFAVRKFTLVTAAIAYLFAGIAFPAGRYLLGPVLISGDCGRRPEFGSRRRT